MQDDDELYGGARRRAPEPSPAQVKAGKFKSQIKENNAEFLDKYMQHGYEQARPGKYKEKGEKLDKMLGIVRQKLIKAFGRRKILAGSTLMKSPRR